MDLNFRAGIYYTGSGPQKWDRTCHHVGETFDPLGMLLSFIDLKLLIWLVVWNTACLLDKVLARSGTGGIYVEPRSADGRSVLSNFMVIWAGKHTLKDLLHMRQTNPAVAGLARVGERRGLRVAASQAQEIHQMVKPDTLFLPQGDRVQYLAGPFPFGTDRQGISKAMRQAGWNCKPLQPSTPQPGRGVMWVVIAVEEPPQPIVWTTHGEILISKHKMDSQAKQDVIQPIASASTLALCGSGPAPCKEDPWSKGDPWGGYKPASSANAPTASASMRQMEDRIQNAVLSTLNTNMVQDDIPDRIQVLEGQMKQLCQKQGMMEHQFSEFTGQQSQQVASLQQQLNAQGQQLHGQIESQNQSIQAMFENQLAHIRGLLTKRPREDGE